MPLFPPFGAADRGNFHWPPRAPSAGVLTNIPFQDRLEYLTKKMEIGAAESILGQENPEVFPSDSC